MKMQDRQLYLSLFVVFFVFSLIQMYILQDRVVTRPDFIGTTTELNRISRRIP